MDYTKGEWKAWCLGSEGYQVRKNNDGIPAAKVKEELKERLTPIVERMGGSFETQRINAYKIAAVPELIEALIGCTESLCSCCKRLNPQHKDCTSCEEMDGYRKALAKTEGK